MKSEIILDVYLRYTAYTCQQKLTINSKSLRNTVYMMSEKMLYVDQDMLNIHNFIKKTGYEIELACIQNNVHIKSSKIHYIYLRYTAYTCQQKYSI